MNIRHSSYEYCFFINKAFSAFTEGLYDADVILKQLRGQIPLFSIPFNHQ